MAQKPRSVLIVDDSETNILLLETILQEGGWGVTSARSAKSAMKILKTKRPGLILLDLLMPEIDGREMLEWLKSDELYKDIPVIVISAITDENVRNSCLEKGACHYMRKPVKIQELLEITRSL